ncbi:MAG: Cell division protein FtsA [Cryomorphaceae bacterium]|nr:MAG: Cell division protein FtsA [Cryomorphaceae bacterium]
MTQNAPLAVGLDIGTTKIVAVVGRLDEHGKIDVLGIGKSKSLGVQRGVVANITLTIESIKAAVKIAEEASGLKITEVMVGIAGQHIRSMQHSDYIMRDDAEAIIDVTDLEALKKNVNNLVMMPGEQILHALPQEYRVDGDSNIINPRGMYGSRLEANFHIVVGQIASIKNIARCVEQSELKVGDITLEPLASADAVLGEDEKDAGVVLVDIGGGTTDIAIFKDGIIRHTAVIPFGGKVITEDIKEGCEIIEKQAELLKVKFGSAWPGENKDNEIVSIPGLRGRAPKEISLKTLSKIINARVKEIIESVVSEISNYQQNDPRKKLIAGIVVTGGGSQLKHMGQLVEYLTGMQTRIGYPNEHLASGYQKELASPVYATSIGLLSMALSETTEPMAYDPNEIVLPESEATTEAVPEEILEEGAPEQEGSTKAKPRKDPIWKGFVSGIKQWLEDDDIE